MTTPTAEQLAADETALTQEVGAVPVTRDVVVVSGPDAEWFLQGQLSQDIGALEANGSAWALLLAPQGKVDAWLRVNRLAEDRFVLDVDAGWAPAVEARLGRYRLRTKVTFESATWGCVAVRGPGTAPALAASSPADGLIEAPAQWPGVDGTDLLVTGDGTGDAWARLPGDLARCSAAALEAVRIAAGVPAMGAELTADTIPAEALVVERSVSFTKGCYTGQELVARIDSRGSNTPRRMRGVIAHGPVAVGDDVVVDGAAVATLTSVERSELRGAWIGLAMVRRSVDPSQAPVSAAVGSRAVPAQIHQLPLPGPASTT